MSANLKKERRRVLSTAKIDGGAYRWVELADGSSLVEGWDAACGSWKAGGATIGEVMGETPPVSPEFATRLGIPIEDLQEGTDRPITSTEVDRYKDVGRFKPDYGLRLLNDGYSSATDLCFYEFRLFSISVLGNGNYSTTVELRHDGELHVLSLDFSHAQLEKILAGANTEIATAVQNELSQAPTIVRTIELEEHVPFAVRARLGSLQTTTREQFVPLVAQEILPGLPNPARGRVKNNPLLPPR